MKLFNTLTRSQVALLHGVGVTQVSRWHRLGMPRNPDLTYSGADTIAWRLARQPHRCRTCGSRP